MKELEQRIFSQETQGVPTAPRERRREPRTQVARPVYVQPADPSGAYFEEVRTMSNFSRSGLYFVTQIESYREGMQLYVIPAFGCFNFEYLGKVVRAERLPCGDYGIAVQLLRVGNSVLNTRPVSKTAFQSFAFVDHAAQ
jgi:hypothetical protein